MSLVSDTLRNLLGKELVVICTDGQAYKGRLEKFDEEAVSIKEVQELRKEDLRWVDPTISPRSDGADVGGQLDAYGSVDINKIRASLRHVVIRTSTISRIWPWDEGGPDDDKPQEYNFL